MTLGDLVVIIDDNKSNLGVVCSIKPEIFVHPHGNVVWTNQPLDFVEKVGQVSDQELAFCQQAASRLLGISLTV